MKRLRSRSANGSPPRPWGRPVELILVVVICRFTPTPVGTAAGRRQRPRRVPVHPHARGDGPDAIVVARRPVGSPPRPWGRQERIRDSQGEFRFTPTPVGTAAPPAAPRSALPVHPHARGDGSSRRRRRARTRGSPPRPWGRHGAELILMDDLRFTPTPVGTAGSAGPGTTCRPVHPHARGDGKPRIEREPHAVGSPPRPWGRLGHPLFQLLEHRFTPTPVGTATIVPAPPRGTTVHPHARGDG